MPKKTKRKVPRFYGVRLFAVALALYFLLTASMFLILGIQSLPGLVERYPDRLENMLDQLRERMEEGSARGVTETTIHAIIGTPLTPEEAAIAAADPDAITALAESEPSTDAARTLLESRSVRAPRPGQSVLLLHLLVVPLVTLLGAAALVQPYKRFLALKRTDREVPRRLASFCRATLRHTPWIFAGLVLLPHVALIFVVSGGVIAGVTYPEIDSQGELFRFLAVGLAAAALQALFVQAWQRYRVQMVYLEQFFSQEELEASYRSIHLRGISSRLWLTSTMTTFLPVAIMVSYVAWSIGSTGPLFQPSGESLSVLLGDYGSMLTNLDERFGFLGAAIGWASRRLGGLWYVNAVDSVLMVAGIASGALITIVYVVLLIRWTTGSIVRPVRELVAGMRRSAEGEFRRHAVVRDRDEIGELTHGFNRMNDQLLDYFARISRLNEAYHQFVPEQFLKILGRESIEDVKLGDQTQREMTLLFCDIRSFTALTEKMQPAESFAFINQYLSVMEPAIIANEGFIDKYVGDAIMAIFDGVADNALAAGLAMRKALLQFNRSRKNAGLFTVHIGIGLHTGTLMLGLVGGPVRMDGTVISDAVNLASRLEGLTKPFGCAMIASDETCRRAAPSERWSLRSLGDVAVSGRADPVGIVEVLDPSREIDEPKIRNARTFASALSCYASGDFTAATGGFEECTAQNPSDGPARYFLARARHYRQKSPPAWHGVEVFSSK
jgi:class 3 adenylate cyclase/HAMP domain-containing protein